MPERENVPEVNKKLKTILMKLDQLISLKQEREFNQILPKLEEEIKKIKGEEYKTVKTILDKMVDDITKELRESDSISSSEIETAKKMRTGLNKAKQPLDKADKVVAQLMENGFSEEELRKTKEEQKALNEARIQSAQKSSETLVENSAILEEYKEELSQITENEKTIERIMREKEIIDRLDLTIDASAVAARKNNIASLLSHLENNGIDISSLSGWEDNMNLLETFKDATLAQFEIQKQDIFTRLKEDKRIDEGLRGKYGIEAIANAEGLNKAYNSMMQDWSKKREKIQTLQAENQEIDETIAQIEAEKEINDLYENYDADKAIENDEIATLAMNDATEMIASGRNAWENWGLRAQYDKDDREYARKKKRLDKIEAKNRKIEEINEERRQAGKKEKKLIEPDENGRTAIRPIRWLMEKTESLGLTLSSRTATIGKKRSKDFYDRVVDDYLEYHVRKKAEQVTSRKSRRDTAFISDLKKSAIKGAVSSSKTDKDIISEVTKQAYKGVKKTDYPETSQDEDREDD